jgi:alpha-beta hydrolase superfamily lysophospholipase
MGGLIASIVMSRLPSLISRAALCAPMFRNKCGMKALDFKFPLPQPVAYWVTYLSCYAGLGTMHALGFFKESNFLKLKANVVTSDEIQLHKWQALRERYPSLVATCVTNDWVLHSIRAQKKFALRYELVRTNTIVFR